jgi:hypothetical protein
MFVQHNGPGVVNRILGILAIKINGPGNGIFRHGMSPIVKKGEIPCLIKGMIFPGRVKIRTKA